MKRKIFNIICAVFFLIALSTSCSNLGNVSNSASKTKDGKICVALSIASNAKTILAQDVALKDMSYQLNGVGGNNAISKGWSTYDEFTRRNEIYLEEGHWTLTLTASKNGTNIYTATVSQTISSSANTVSFVLKESTDVNGSGTIYIKLLFEDVPDVTYVKAGIMSVQDYENAYDFYDLSDLNIENNSVTYTNSIYSGVYVVKFFLYDSNNKEIAPGYREVVQVKQERESSAIRTVTSTQRYHSLKLNNISSAEFIAGYTLPLMFSETESVTLPTENEMSRRGNYIFKGWFYDEEFSGEVVTEIPAGTTSDVTLWAKWEEFLVPVTGITISQSDLNLPLYGYEKISATVYPENASYGYVKWDSSDEDIASVSSTSGSGYFIYANGIGEATITATVMGRDYKESEYKAVCKVVVAAGKVALTTQNAYKILGEDYKSKNQIVIPDYVMSIGKDVFTYCTNLTSIMIPASVTEIVSPGFYYCENLSAVYTESIKDWCGISFSSSTSNPLYYAKHLYVGGTEVTDLVIPEGVASINPYAFYGCENLTSIVISNSVKEIGTDAFSCCGGISSIEIGDGITSLDNFGLGFFRNLESAKIGNGVKEIPSAQFNYSYRLKSVTLGNSIESIGERAFVGCSSLESINIPASVTSIGAEAFGICAITSINIPPSVTKIGYRAFAGCENLSAVYIESLKDWCEIDFAGGSNPLYFAKHLYVNGIEVTKLVVPNSITSIKPYAFYGCTGLTDVTLHSNVESIGVYAFDECANIKTVTVLRDSPPQLDCYFGENPEKIYVPFESVDAYKSIEPYTENWWKWSQYESKIEGIVLSDTIVDVELDFTNALLIPNTSLSLKATAFYGDGSTKDVTSTAEWTSSDTSVATVDAGVVTATTAEGTILVSVKAGSVTAEATVYVTTTLTEGVFIWCNPDYATMTEYEIPRGITSIEGDGYQGIFYYCKNLTSVIIPDTVTSIGYHAFYDCSNITSVTIPNTITSIGAYAFYNCSGLKSVTLGNSIESIGESAFRKCSNLESINIPDTVTSIGSYAFFWCSKLESINIPASVKTIGSYAFEGCENLVAVYTETVKDWCGIDFAYGTSNPLYYAKHLYVNGDELTNLVVPNDVTSIGAYAFYNCLGLTSVTIPSSVESVGYSAFYGCENLRAVYAESIKDWCGIDFASCDSNPLYCAKHLYVNGTELTNLVVPDDVVSIGANAFYNCLSITSVTIPDSVKSIGEYAFYGCSNIKTVFAQSRAGWNVISFGNNYSKPNYYYDAKLYFLDELGQRSIVVSLQTPTDVQKLSYTTNGNTVTISAESGHSSYSWFVDLQKQSETKNTLQIDTTDMRLGLHSVMVVIDGEYSSTAAIEISE